MKKSIHDHGTTDPIDTALMAEDEQRFWRALQSDEGVKTLHKQKLPDDLDPDKPFSISQKPVDLTEDLSDLGPEQREHRRQALRSMLAANEARQEQAMRSKMPVLAIGVEVWVKCGPYQNQHGTILDADYIHSRALMELQEEDEAQWVEFSHIGPSPALPANRE